jgi:hypothetical protein
MGPALPRQNLDSHSVAEKHALFQQRCKAPLTLWEPAKGLGSQIPELIIYPQRFFPLPRLTRIASPQSQ